MSSIQKELVKLLEVKESEFEDRQEFLDEILTQMSDSKVVSDKIFKSLSKPTKGWYNTTVDLLEKKPKSIIPEFPDYEDGDDDGDEDEKPRRRRGRDDDEEEKPSKKSKKGDDDEGEEEPGDDEVFAKDCEVDEYYMVENQKEKTVKAQCTSVGRRVVKFETVKGDEEVCLTPNAFVGLMDDTEEEKPAKRGRRSKKEDEEEKPAKRGRKSKKDDDDEKPAKRSRSSKSKKAAQMPDSIFSVVGAIFCDDPEITSGDVIIKLEEEGHDFKKDSVYVYLCTLKKSYDIFKENGLID